MARRWERRIFILGQIVSRGARRVALSVNTRSTWIKLFGWLLERSSRRVSTTTIGVSCCCEIDMEVGIGVVVVVGGVVVGVVVDVVVGGVGVVFGSLELLLLDDQARISAKRSARCCR